MYKHIYLIFQIWFYSSIYVWNSDICFYLHVTMVTVSGKYSYMYIANILIIKTPGLHIWPSARKCVTKYQKKIISICQISCFLESLKIVFY